MTNIIYSGENSELFEKSYPYVYAGIRKADEKIYIGARYAHINYKRSVKEDFGQHYFTSSEKVEFDEFDWEILYIGNNSKDSQDVFKFEAELINEHWGQPYLLNRYNPKSGKFNAAGRNKENDPRVVIRAARISNKLFEWWTNAENFDAIVKRNKSISNSKSAWWLNPDNEDTINEMLQKQSAARIEYFSNPENKEAIKEMSQKVSNSMKGVHKGKTKETDQGVAKQAVLLSQYFSNPENKEAIKISAEKRVKTILSKPEIFCPHCGKKYKFQGALESHIKVCTNKYILLTIN
jgi:hypothetical protein